MYQERTQGPHQLPSFTTTDFFCCGAEKAFRRYRKVGYDCHVLENYGAERCTCTSNPMKRKRVIYCL